MSIHTDKIKELARELHDKAGEQDNINSLYNDIVRCCNHIDAQLNRHTSKNELPLSFSPQMRKYYSELPEPKSYRIDEDKIIITSD